MKSKFSYPIWVMILGSIALLSAHRVLAQDSPDAAAPGRPAETDAKDVDDKVIREQSIYIPYEKLRNVFEKEGRGVFLPHEKFRELWEAAREKTKPAAEQKPPVGALITEVRNEATAEKDVVRVKAVLKIEVLAKGWSEVPLRLADAAITSATLGDRPARIVSGGEAGYKLLVEKKGEAPEQIELVLEYAKAISRSPGRNSVSFQSPQAPVSRWRVRIPEPGVKVDLFPLIAATEVPAGDEPGADAPEAASEAGETVVLAFVGAAPSVRIEWTPKAEGATGMEALASVQVDEQVTIGESVTRTRAELAYTISRAELGTLSIGVPSDQKVVNVFDANVRQWTVESADQDQRINVQLFEPAKASQRVVVELEQFAGDEDETATPSDFQTPVIRALGVGRQQGVVVVRVAEGLRAEATQVSGLLQVDAAELPQALAGGHWAFAYRYAAVPFELHLKLEKILPRVVADSLVEAELDPKRLSLDVLTLYTIERAGVFRLELDVPAGFDVRDVRGREAAGAAAVEVDAHHLEGDQKTRLVVNLARKALGRVGLFVELEKDLEEPALLAPAGKADVSLPIPQVVAESVERAAGRLIVYASENLLVSPVEDEPEGFRSITTKAALDGMEVAPGRDPASVRPVKAYAYAQEQGSLVLRAERRKPQVRVRQLLAAKVEDGAIQYEATFFYDILYSSVPSLRIDVPAKVAPNLRNKTAAVQETEIVPAPDDVPEGYVAWSFTGDAELIGQQKIELAWKTQLDERLESGKPVEVAIPHLKPVGADLPWGQIVLSKAETIDLDDSGSVPGLRPIDPLHDLMPGADVPGAARAYEFHEDWSLAVTATRYELEEVEQTSIERAVLRMVVTRADKIAVQALYRMRSARQRIAVRIPKGGEFDSEPKINGRPVPLEINEGRGDEYLVPLTGQDAKESFLLELRYTVESEGSEFRLDRPEFPLDSTSDAGAEPALQEMYLCVYLPEELDLVEKTGPWTEQYGWGLTETLDFRPVARPNDLQLLGWVAPEEDLGESFPTDGRLYVFSALRPAPPPGGSLHLAAVAADRLTTCVIAAVVLLGLLLVPFRPGKRVFAIGAVVIALVFCGVYRPILLRQICDGALVSAVLIVLVLWTGWYFLWTRPRARRRRLRAGPPPSGPSLGKPVGGPPSGPPPSDAPHRPSPSQGQAGSPFSATAKAPKPEQAAATSAKPAESRPSESAIEWDPSKAEEPSEVFAIEEPPAEDASEGLSVEEEPKSDRGKGGPSNA